jgi:hypothetical protein
MTKATLLPVGTKQNPFWKPVIKGDVVELVTGEKVTFIEAKRVWWRGQFNGKGIRVPLYRDRMHTEPYILKIVGRDESVMPKAVNPTKLKFGELFFLEGHKETFLFVGDKTKRGGRKVMTARDLATRKNYTIDPNMTFVKIDLNKLKKELKTA